MQPFAIGTVVRARNNQHSAYYCTCVYGQIDGFVISAIIQPTHSGHYSHYYQVSRLDGSNPTQPGYGNAITDEDLEVDIFMHACREAIKEAQCHTGEDNSKS